MAKFTVNITGIKEITKKIKDMPHQMAAEIDARIDDSMQAMRAGAIRDAPGDNANLRQGIGYARTGKMTYELFSNAHYSPYMEFGTKGRYKAIPGIDASQFKRKTAAAGGKGFYDSILSWVKRKKIAGSYSVKSRRRTGNKVDQQIEDEQTAFAIYLSIMRHGVKPHPFFFKQLAAQQPKLIADIENAIKTVVE